jgi:hypothetical protein
MKKQMKNMIVPNVRIGQDVCAVRFKVLPVRKTIKCSTKGQEPFFVRQDGKDFIAGQGGPIFKTTVTARHPAQVFAKAVKEFWTLW